MRTTCLPHPSAALLAAFVLLAAILVSAGAAAAAAPTDGDVTEKVEQEILFDPAAPANDIDVATTSGIVTLRGTVDNLLAKERATRIAETVRGVRSVVNLIEVEPGKTRTAEQLQKQVEAALYYDVATEGHEIDVSAGSGGEVTLSGTVQSWPESRLVELVAKGVSGVTAVTNRIVVDPKDERLDAEVRPEIVARLHWDTLIDDDMIDVRVDEGKVRLSGVVGSAAEKSRAIASAWMVAGVQEVDAGALAVEKWARDDDLRRTKYVERTDAEIRDAVRTALIYDPRVKSFNVDVKARGSYVTLSGVVDNVEARMAAERDARNTVGVLGVTNLIKVRASVDVPDDRIASAVHGALFRNPYTETYEITVTADDGVVHLTGTVDTYFEKAEAERVASRAKGVTGVRNGLVVERPGILVYDPYVYNWSIYEFPWYDGNSVVQSKGDREIRQDIETELMWSPFVDADDVNVMVTAGIATLTGMVDSWSEYRAARENAFEGGAHTVINNIDVR